MTISIIIPTYNESRHIHRLMSSIAMGKTTDIEEVMVIDSANSTDNLIDTFSETDVKYIKSGFCTRASQMNFGASIAKGEVLFFVHADTILPLTYAQDIQNQLSTFDLGCFRAKIDSTKFLLKINSFFTRFPFLWCRGGDQTLFIKKKVFLDLGAYDESYVIMEEYDFLRKALGKYKFGIVKKSVIVSARKYENNKFWKIQLANLMAMRMFFKGSYSPKEIKAKYTQILDLEY
jgi:rSAM/selenodomain-associated transferase 2